MGHWAYTEQELTALLGPAWVPSRRFGINQGGKTRPDDDDSESLVNRDVTCNETVMVDGVDRVAGTLKPLARVLGKKTVEVALLTGEVMRGVRHEAHDRPLRQKVACLKRNASSRTMTS